MRSTQTVVVRVSRDMDDLLSSLSQELTRWQKRKITKAEASLFLVRFYRNNKNKRRKESDWAYFIDL